MDEDKKEDKKEEKQEEKKKAKIFGDTIVEVEW